MKPLTNRLGNIFVERIINTPVSYVLENYSNPWDLFLNAKIRIYNIRIKGAFKNWGVGCLAQGKFYIMGEHLPFDTNETAERAKQEIKKNGYMDRCRNGVFAFGKSMRAHAVEMFVNETELWNVSQVYDFDYVEFVEGEGVANSENPHLYIRLQSQLLFKRKSEVKHLMKTYKQGEAYTGDIGETIPAAIAETIRSGECTDDFLSGFYMSTKGAFNGIYGTQAINIYRPSHYFDEFGEISVNPNELVTPERFDDMQPKTYMSDYNFGARIVGGSRVHLIIAMSLLYDSFGDSVDVTGGDTDSLKIRCNENVKPADLLQSLQPLHDAVTRSIHECTTYERVNFPAFASDLQDVGVFEVENETPYVWHCEFWNKNRVSYDGVAHLTAAGISRPANAYNIENLLTDEIKRIGFERAVSLYLGYNVEYSPTLTHSLQHHKPRPDERMRAYITDCNGVNSYVDEPQSIALYPSSRMLGRSETRANGDTLEYMKHNVRFVDVAPKYIDRIDQNIIIEYRD